MAMKTHHYSIVGSIVIAAIQGIQGAQGQPPADISSPEIWSQVFLFATTIIGFIRNKAQP